MIGVFCVEYKYMNVGGVVYGGCLMSFVDFMLFFIVWDVFEDGSMGVIMIMNIEFFEGVCEGVLVIS